MYQLINGKEVSEKVLEQIRQEVIQLKQAGKKTPHLAAVLVGDNPASMAYVNSKIKTCEKVGVTSTLVKFETDVTEQKLLSKIEELNNDTDVDGYIVQLPLPKHIAEQKIIEAIAPSKDVDGFHPINVGKLVLNLPTYISATPYGIIQLLEYYKIPTQGKHCVVIGRSNIVGTPMSILMAKNTQYANCTVTLCHSKTENLKQYTLAADIVIAAIGKPNYVTADMVKQGATVIDVGINRIPSTETKSGFKLVGDVLFDEVAPMCSYITPVPGGVGLMTIASLLKNTLLAAKKEIYK
ncbi:MAG TPA: bifunctional methylenetetrahydrofolate dehydrogenase/methenyltetrahydrofolate cyclohydrolase FolD [Bacteroidia bacterium]|jgi:methylenetetrahydrofolate dehydrogenase (NADP+)/methenyltetrahydrofolate cyclohydrolase|nr:bifunctional methylenetetrahydrofolate dehydrogenase/methenyltetrahydrofolate cyclohydrolase FolD [Bacteroidia bacterium]